MTFSSRAQPPRSIRCGRWRRADRLCPGRWRLRRRSGCGFWGRVVQISFSGRENWQVQVRVSIVQQHERPYAVQALPGILFRGFPLLAEARLRQLRRPSRADRDHAPGSGRAETLDLREALPARAQLLHGTAGAGGPAARHLYRLDDAPDLGWSDIGRPLRATVAFYPDRVDLGLPRVRKRAA